MIVPIVYGPHIDDCKRIAPPNSFIHVSSFKNNAELVQYLDYLGNLSYTELSGLGHDFGHERFDSLFR